MRGWKGIAGSLIAGVSLVGTAIAGSAAASSWIIVPTPNPSGSSLDGLTCLATTNCWAVGSEVVGHGVTAIIDHSNGTAWSSIGAPVIANQYSGLGDVTCTSATSCWAVGGAIATTPPFHERTLIEYYNGASWTVFSSPNPHGPHAGLASVACPSATSCWAVGTSLGASRYRTLVEHYDGTDWKIVRSPNRSGENNLNRVSCLSVVDCWAVGSYGQGLSNPTLIEHYDGRAWSIVKSPNPIDTQHDILSALTCVSATSCWAAGYSVNGTTDATLMEHYDGVVWSVVSSADTGKPQNVLDAVTCVTGSACWAVGYGGDNSSDFQTLVEYYDGTAWSIASSPNASVANNELLAVTCNSTTLCWASGQEFSEADGFDIPLMERGP